MKTKTLIRIAAICIVPILLSTILNMIIGMTYYFSINPSESTKFYIGLCNNGFVAIVDLFGVFAFSIIASAIISMNKYAPDIERLDAAIEEYELATKEMENARDKYTELLKTK